MNRSLLRTGGLIVATALVSGGTAYAVSSNQTPEKTIVRQVSAPVAQNTSQQPSTGLSVNEIYRRSAPGVVVVRSTVTTTQQNPFGSPQQQQSQALGSGFVIDQEGHILTNAHVVLDASKVEVGFSNGDNYPAEVVGLDKSTDVAVLKVDVPSSALRVLPLANSNDVHVGDPVVAIGNPLGETRTVTSGIVSAIDRQIQSLQPGVSIFGAIQTDAAINHGNSGGPLLNSQGQVIGITSQILSDDQNNPESGNIGIGFAIPINTAKQVGEQIINSGKAEHTYIGVEGTPLTPDVAKALNIDVSFGVLVAKVEPGSPAAKAGLQGGNTQATIAGVTYTLGGDVITKIDGKEIKDFSVLADTISQKQPGDTVTLEVFHNGQTRTVTVTLAAH